MGETISLTAADGARVSAYRARPKGAPRAGLIVIQEIFGVNGHMRAVTDRFAEAGYDAICPALFDRAEAGAELGYSQEDGTRGRELRAKVGWDGPLADLAAARDQIKGHGTVGAVGYCWGGSLAWLSATRLKVDAAVGYYGGQIAQFAAEKPTCPVMLHFGEKDAMIPMTDVEAVRKAHPEIDLHVYPADHGFNCFERGSYHAESAELALSRTLAFLEKHLR